MKRYFFDRVGGGQAEYDYHGRMLSTPEAARQLAEVIALDLELMDEGGWSGWAINVHTAVGQQPFSVPVPASAQMAA
jgi:hypothetical protein